MIKSFEHKGLRKFFETGNLSGVQPGHKQKLRIRLIALDSSTCIDDMNTPGWRLHSLKLDDPVFLREDQVISIEKCKGWSSRCYNTNFPN
ncbi:hypothetical protein DO021_11210 [Desulfobacter hydrogenophilus]|uniref:Uncharacterized protein n=1 Tax=Desulfobacter hydrogenophilus TaxID=2291 RepID=A0A328FG55_9BACT|nr:type II toxin-antitoxin system RelE/ParE family toxin [Desulfobacter hydrogenophilus]NDY72082.1 hypothetical protein [Desulfobacter hydrogenophilus]QBH11502.1 hypothetical protein EYB58_00315 [Desulfobacter hydrogenophilus]RAM02007.1 hypothetical protein DO021_11210 [Desulfobacter hydrogenophilus]